MVVFDLENELSEMGWTGSELARRLGVDPDTVSRWRRGRIPIPGYASAYLTLAVRAKAVLG